MENNQSVNLTLSPFFSDTENISPPNMEGLDELIAVSDQGFRPRDMRNEFSLQRIIVVSLHQVFSSCINSS